MNNEEDKRIQKKLVYEEKSRAQAAAAAGGSGKKGGRAAEDNAIGNLIMHDRVQFPSIIDEQAGFMAGGWFGADEGKD